MKTETRTTGASLKADIKLGNNDLLRVGSELQRFRLDDWQPASGSGMWPNEFVNINDGERDQGPVCRVEASHGERWTTLLGLRYERVSMNAGLVHGYNLASPPFSGDGSLGMQTEDAAAFNNRDRSRHDNNWDFTALARYAAHAGLDIEFGFARKTRSPSLYEAYPWSAWQMAALMNNFVVKLAEIFTGSRLAGWCVQRGAGRLPCGCGAERAPRYCQSSSPAAWPPAKK